MMKKFVSIVMLLIASVLVSAVAMAQIVDIDYVKVDGDVLSPTGSNQVLDVERGDELKVKVRITALQDADDVQIEAALRGFDSSDTIDDITSTFDVKANVTYIKTLTLPLRGKLDQDRYKLRIRIEDRDSQSVEDTYELEVDTAQHDVEIRDVVVSPDNEVKAGRALLTTVRLRNRGESEEEGVKVVVSVPALGVSGTDFIDELDEDGGDDDEATTEEIFIRIPDSAATGEYTLRVDVYFDEGDKKNTKDMTIFVLGQEQASAPAQKDEEKTIITLAVDKQNAAAGGAEVAYPVTLTNAGSNSKTYAVSADGAAWANFRVSPESVFVLGAGESKAVTVYVSADADAPVGDQTFTLTIAGVDKVLKQVPLQMTVEAAADSSLKRGLEVLLVVLVILLVIIGLIIGFSKLRGDDEEGEEKEYY